MAPPPGICDVDQGILQHILSFLSRREADGARGTCKALHEAFFNVREAGGFRPRLIVVSSGNNTLVELDPRSGAVVRVSPAQAPARKRSRDGVLQLSGEDLAYKRIFSRKGRALGVGDPEGIAFACGSLYVASAADGCVVRVGADGGHLDRISLGEHAVPWGMTFRPAVNKGGAASSSESRSPGSLLVAVDASYETNDYTRVPAGRERGGYVAEVKLTATGDFMPLETYSTEMGVSTGAVWKHYKMNFEADSREPGAPNVSELFAMIENPMDVCLGRGEVYVSSHAGDGDSGRVSVYSREGKLLRHITSPMLQQPNMMAFEL